MMIFQFIGIQIFSIMYLLLLLIVYSSKKRYVSVENNLFKILLIFTIFELFLDIGICYSIKYAEFIPTINMILCKLSLFCYQVWAAILMLYVILLGNKENYRSLNDLLKRNWKYQIGTIVVFLLAFVIFLIPIDYVYDSNYNISYIVGISTTYNYLVTITYLFIILITVLINKNKVTFSKRIPIFVFIITSSIFLPIQRFNSDVPVLIVPLMSFAIMIMYFTLENPDLRLIEELNELKAQAEEGAKVKTKFLDNVSYNMKNPMNEILGFSQTLLTEDLSSNARKDAENINTACKTLLEMVDNTLDISKIESNLCKVNNEEYDLRELINKVCYATSRLIKNDKIKFIVNIDEEIPFMLFGDYNKIYKVLSNVLVNSVKYTKVGKITFSLNGIVKDDNLELNFKISDTGVGIEKDKFDVVFNKFGRIESSDTKGIEGTGLGLALSYEIMNLLNGKISFDSTYGAGTVFYVTLSQKIIKDDKIGKFTVNYNDYDIVYKADYSSHKVLIIDNNIHNINVLKRMFNSYNIKVDYATSNLECTDLLSTNKYDLIFLDDGVVNDNSFNTIKDLKKVLNDDVVLIKIISDSLDASRKYFASQGYNDYIIKPIDIMILDRILNKYLNKK